MNSSLPDSKTTSGTPVDPSLSVAETPSISIEGINEPIISTYFKTLNAGDFQATSQLFTSEGVLHPPFEDTIVGPEAIAAYLEKEAKGFLLQPRQGIERPGEDGTTEIEVIGTVQTPWFSVNVRWLFALSAEKRLLRVKVKLLAAMQDLLNLRSSKSAESEASDIWTDFLLEAG